MFVIKLIDVDNIIMKESCVCYKLIDVDNIIMKQSRVCY